MRIFDTVVIFFLMITLHKSFATSAQDTLCIQSLNIHGAWYAEKLKDRHSRLLSFLQNQICDIILLQEVWLDKHHENINRVSKTINLKSVHFDQMNGQSHNSGLVSLHNAQLLNQGVQYFPDQYKNHHSKNSWFQEVHSSISGIFDINKGFGFMQIQHRTSFADIPILYVNLHLHHLSQQNRILELLFYLQWILSSPYQDHLIITGGDFNFQPDSLEFAVIQHVLRFKDPFIELNKDHDCTHFCDDNQGDYYLLKTTNVQPKTVDYIFFNNSSNIGVRPLSAYVFPKSYNGQTLSDHYGIKTEIEFYTQEHNTSVTDQITTDFLNTINRVENLFDPSVDASNIVNETSIFQQSYDNTFSTDVQHMISLLKTQLQDANSPLMRYLSQNP